MANSASAQTIPMFSRIRLATISDVRHMYELGHQMAVFEGLTHLFTATESSLSECLFPSTGSHPFYSPTAFILEVSLTPFTDTPKHTTPLFDPIEKVVNFKLPFEYPDREKFRVVGSENNAAVTVAGYTMFYPNFSAFLGKRGFYGEDILVRECYRRKGFGRMLVSAVAKQTVRMGYARFDWVVLNWNVNAIKLYEDMGATIYPDWRCVWLTGHNLEAYRAYHPDSKVKIVSKI